MYYLIIIIKSPKLLQRKYILQHVRAQSMYFFMRKRFSTESERQAAQMYTYKKHIIHT